jgi:hypothetical protein
MDHRETVLIGAGVALVFMAVMMGGGVWVWVRTRRRGHGWWRATAVMLLAQLVFASAWGFGAEQVLMHRRAADSDESEYRITPGRDPLPERRVLPERVRRVGPVILRREVEEVGIPELGGGSRVVVMTMNLARMLAITGIVVLGLGPVAVVGGMMVRWWGARGGSQR